MVKKDLEAKTVAELRQMAAKRGIAAGRGWKKKDFIKALSSKKKSAVKAAKPARVVLPPLSPEYGENKVVSIPVSPARIYVYWEVAENKMAEFKGSLNIKLSDAKTNSFFYTPVSGRFGESFINVSPESDYSVELGVIDFRGEFVNIVKMKKRKAPRKSDAVTREPEGREPEGRELPDEFFEMPDSVSSY